MILPPTFGACSAIQRAAKDETQVWMLALFSTQMPRHFAHFAHFAQGV
jgi:hypothetical protein